MGGALALTGPWPDPVVPETSLPEFLLATATKQAERAAIIDASSGRALSYAELADGVRRVASGLAALGCGPGTCSRSWPRTRPSGCWPVAARWPPAG